MERPIIFALLIGFPKIRINLYQYRGHNCYYGGRSSKRIERYRVRNFFRKILGKPLLKPRRLGRWQQPYIRVQESNNSTYLYFKKGYTSMIETNKELYDIINEFTWVHDNYKVEADAAGSSEESDI